MYLVNLRPREFPAQLDNSAPELPTVQVVGAWTAYLAGARLTAPQVGAGQGVRSITDYCTNGRGKVLRDPAVAGATFRWTIEKPAVSAWNDALLVVAMDDPEKPTKLGKATGEEITFQLNREDLAKTGIYDMPAACPVGG